MSFPHATISNNSSTAHAMEEALTLLCPPGWRAQLLPAHPGEQSICLPCASLFLPLSFWSQFTFCLLLPTARVRSLVFQTAGMQSKKPCPAGMAEALGLHHRGALTHTTSYFHSSCVSKITKAFLRAAQFCSSFCSLDALSR